MKITRFFLNEFRIILHYNWHINYFSRVTQLTVIHQFNKRQKTEIIYNTVKFIVKIDWLLYLFIDYDLITLEPIADIIIVLNYVFELKLCKFLSTRCLKLINDLYSFKNDQIKNKKKLFLKNIE